MPSSRRILLKVAGAVALAPQVAHAASSAASRAPARKGAKTIVSGPTQAGDAAQGKGAEPATPTTGGATGPGGGGANRTDNDRPATPRKD